ncbi:MAG: RIP metalloprotease RseP [Candidatus Marinimicrobia bacterium]|nr:RIP metalloprotease RseP [Candidatus Neomarinimicrobiota bacterium]|tara:strand:+ start:2280 stop:3359 length:1080 start_codon:yes stop_codon:yes gene_type:complete
MYTFLAFIAIFGGVVFIHELGHFLAARSVGVRVDKFYVGMDLFGLGYVLHKGQETEYGIGLFPFGGYCKIAGMVDESLDPTVKGSDDEFNSKNTFEKLWILSAGVIMNFILAIVLFFAVFTIYGESTLAPIAYDITKDGPAENAGLKPGSLITKINKQNINSWSDISNNLLNINQNEEISIEYKLNNQYKTVSLIPDLDKDNRFLIGIKRVPDNIIESNPEQYIVFNKINLLEGFKMSIIAPLNIIIMQMRGLSQLISGNVGLDSLGGPIKITQMAGQAAQFGLSYFLQFMAMISTILGFMNILPIPGLDGGHALIAIIEGLARREIPFKIKMIIQQIAIFLILGLTVFVLGNDIKNLF